MNRIVEEDDKDDFGKDFLPESKKLNDSNPYFYETNQFNIDPPIETG